MRKRSSPTLLHEKKKNQRTNHLILSFGKNQLSNLCNSRVRATCWYLKCLIFLFQFNWGKKIRKWITKCCIYILWCIAASELPKTKIISMQLSQSHFEQICRAQVSLLSGLSSPSEKGLHPT